MAYKIDPELKRYLEIENRLSNHLKVDSNDLSFFSKYVSTLTPDKIKELNDQLDESSKNGEDKGRIDAQRAAILAQSLLSDPTYKEQVLKDKKNFDEAELNKNLSQGLNTLMSGADISMSLNQINKSNQQLSSLRPPSRPSIPSRDAYLQDALRKAQMGIYDTSQAVAPAQADIADQYYNDIQNARNASAGQAGSFQAGVQSAANRRNRASLGLVPLANDVRRQNQSLYNELVGQHVNETQNIYNNQAQLYPYDVQQYQYQNMLANELGAFGRHNLSNSLANLGKYASQGISNYITSKRYNDAVSSIRKHSDDAANAMEKGSQLYNKYYGGPGNFNEIY